MALLSWAAKRLGNSCSQGRDLEQRTEEDHLVIIPRLIPGSENSNVPKLESNHAKSTSREDYESLGRKEEQNIVIPHAKKRELLFDLNDYPIRMLAGQKYDSFDLRTPEISSLIKPNTDDDEAGRKNISKRRRRGDYRVLPSSRKLVGSSIFTN